MHEVSLIEALFDQADRAIAPHHPGDVRRVTLRVGALSGVEPELLRAAFEGCRGDRGYLRASLLLRDEPAAWRCEACGEALGEALPLACARCGGDARLAQGDALILERLELEVPDV